MVSRPIECVINDLWVQVGFTTRNVIWYTLYVVIRVVCLLDSAIPTTI